MRTARVNEEGRDIRYWVVLKTSVSITSFDIQDTHGYTEAAHYAHTLHRDVGCGWHQIMVYRIDALRSISGQTSQNEP
jgi:hypothetical protein